jgi:hypothetical protein
LSFQFWKRPNEHTARSEHAVTIHTQWDDKSGYELYAAPTIHVLDATADTATGVVRLGAIEGAARVKI